MNEFSAVIATPRPSTIDGKYYTNYVIENLLNGRFYYGAHETFDLDDDYQGSGDLIKLAIAKYWWVNFRKWYVWFGESKAEMFRLETMVVDEEFVARPDTYNIALGGDVGNIARRTMGAIDAAGKCYRVKKDDPRLVTGELTPLTKNTVCVKDSESKVFRVPLNDPRYISGELIAFSRGMMKGQVVVRDPLVIGKCFYVAIDDPRYISGELIHNCSGTKHTKEWIENTRKDRSQRVWIHKNSKDRHVKESELQTYVLEGWVRGRVLRWKASDETKHRMSEAAKRREAVRGRSPLSV